MNDKLLGFSRGDRVTVTEEILRSYPKWRGRLGTVIANPNTRKTIPTVGVQFDGLKTVHYLHVDFLRHVASKTSDQRTAVRG